MQLREAVGKRVEEVLAERKITMYQLNKRSGVSKSTLNNIVRGTYGSVTLRIIHELWQGLDMPIVEFFDSAGNGAPLAYCDQSILFPMHDGPLLLRHGRTAIPYHQTFHSFYAQRELTDLLFSGNQSAVLPMRIDQELRDYIHKQFPEVDRELDMRLTYQVLGSFYVFNQYYHEYGMEETLQVVVEISNTLAQQNSPQRKANV